MIATIEPAGPRQQTRTVERWLDEHGDYLYRFAVSKLRDRTNAEDTVQETLLAAIRSYDSFSDRSAERTWLTGILKHKIADQYRSMFRELPFVDPIGNEIESKVFDADGHWRTNTRDLPSREFEQKEMIRSLRTALACLPRRLAVVWTLREIEGMGTTDICSLLSISPEYLFVLLHRARLRLRSLLALHLASWISCKVSHTSATIYLTIRPKER